jgi:hypothetical protein
MAEFGIQIGKLFFVGLLSVILTFDIVVGLQALYYWQLNRTETAESLYRRPAKLNALTDAQKKRLTEYRMLDAKNEIVAIPIDRAMRLVVTELSQGNGRNDPPPQGETR